MKTQLGSVELITLNFELINAQINSWKYKMIFSTDKLKINHFKKVVWSKFFSANIFKTIVIQNILCVHEYYEMSKCV